MSNYILYIDGKEVSLENFLEETGLTEDMATILITSDMPMKTMKGKRITYKLKTN